MSNAFSTSTRFKKNGTLEVADLALQFAFLHFHIMNPQAIRAHANADQHYQNSHGSPILVPPLSQSTT